LFGLEQAVRTLRGQAALEGGAATSDCLDELVVADFLDGRLMPEARAPVVAHLLACGRCRSMVRAAGALLADAEVARSMPRDSSSSRRRWSLPVGIAAAAALLIAVLPRQEPPPVLREPDITSTVAPVPIAPRASVAGIDRLVWSSVPGAARYRLRVYDGEGSVVWMVVTTDTAVMLPDSVVLSPGVSYFWRVEAESEFQRWAASDLVEFRLGGTR
jgi:hypothetical protein